MDAAEPDPSREDQGWTPRHTMGCILVIVLAGAAAAGVKACGSMVGSVFESTPRTRGMIAGQMEIQGQLTSPGSIKWIERGEVQARSLDGDYILFYFVLDSQNAMGALLRSYWLVLTHDIGEDRDPQIVDYRSFGDAPIKMNVFSMMNDMLPRDEWVTEEQWKALQADD